MASSKIKGITIEIGGDTTKLSQALQGVEEKSRNLQKELNGVNKLLKLDPSNVDLLKQKQEILNESIESTSKKLNSLKEVEKQVQEQFKKGDITKEQYRDFQREIIATEQKLTKLKEEMNDFGSVTEQRCKAASKKMLDFSSKVDEAANKMSKLSLGAASAISGSIVISSSLESALAKYMATTGKATEETEKYEKTLKSIHDNNYGESFEDIADKMRIVENILGDMPTDSLQNIVEKSYMLQDAYDIDFQEGIRGVDALMKQFGITANEAYELINQGAQKGLNQNKDLGDQIAEYSVHWADLGFEAEDMFNSLIAGAKSGTFTIDYLNDAIKEMGIRVLEGSDNQKEAFKSLGLNADEMIRKFGEGGALAKEAFQEVSNALLSLEDPIKRNEIGIELFGTKFEDLGEDAVFAMFNAQESVKKTGDTVKQTTDKMYGTTKDQVEQTMRKIKTSFGSMSKNVLPIVEKVASVIEKWTKKLDGLSDETKNTIATVLSLTAVSTPLLKVGSSIIKSGSSLINVVGKMSTAFKAGKTATDMATKAQLANNAAVLANPYVLAAGAVLTLAAAYMSCNKKSGELSKAIKEESESVDEACKSWDELIVARNKSINEGINEVNYYQELSNELKELVDENGRVKEGYEGRASFITSTLASAFDVEIEMIDGVIQNYKNLENTIDAIIEKKKASIILENQEDSYKTAISNREVAINKLGEYEEKINDLDNKIISKRKEWELVRGNDIKKEIQTADELAKLEKEYNEYKKMYTKQTKLVENYAYDISTYENNMALFHEGKYNEMSKVNYNYLNTLDGVKTSKKDIINAEIKDEENYLNTLKKMKEESGSNLYDLQIEQSQKRIEQLQNDLKTEEDSIYNSLFSINEKTEEEINQLIESLNGKTVTFQDLGNGYVQMYANGIAVGTPIVRSEAENLLSQVKQPLSILKGEGSIAGENLVEGLKIGVNNKKWSLVNTVEDVGNVVLSTLRSALNEHSPSKASEEMGVFLDEGLEVGILKQKSRTLNQVSKFGQSILDSLNNELQDGAVLNTNINGNKNLMFNTLIDTNPVKSNNSTAKDTEIVANLLDKYMPEIIKKMPTYILLDGKVVGKTIAPEVNKQLGEIAAKEKRGY